MLDLAIIGGGPAGLTAGLYATRGGLKNVTMFEKGLAGGQIILSSEVENYPGYKNVVSGEELMESWPEQCMRFGLKQEMKNVILVSKNENNIFEIKFDDGGSINAKSVLVCTGSLPKKAGFKGEDEFFGRGVSTCATCDGFFYKNREVAVIGGGDTALEEALHLAKICSKVYIIHRRDVFRAAPSTYERAVSTSNIEFILNSSVKEAYGDKTGLLGLKIQSLDKNEIDLKVPVVFVLVGRNVSNDILKTADGFLCELNDIGEVIVDLNMKTSVSGLFCAGDMRIDSAKQVVCAAADGAVAALGAINYVNH